MATEANNHIELDPYQVILRPLVTEKGMHLSERYNSYAFEVNALASKEDIRIAVEALWGVKVVKVRTQNRKGKPRRHKASAGYTKDWKKALVQLDDADRIAFF
jgi:large subunit ribosomal protein L23